MTIFAESAHPLSSALARERQASIDEAAVRAAAQDVDTVMSKYVSVDTRKMARITSLPPTNPNQVFAAQQLMRSTKQAQTDILVICDSRCDSQFGSPGGNAPSTELSGVLSTTSNRPPPPETPSLITFLAGLESYWPSSLPVRRLLTFSFKC